MKKLLLSIIFFLIGHFTFADGTEQVCVTTNTGSTGQACTASELGFINPCITVPL